MATVRAEKGPSPHGAAGRVTLRYWAAARAATGVESDVVDASGAMSLGELRAAAVALHPGAEKQLAVCSVLVNDLPVSTADPASYLVDPGAVVEFLPPFAGG